MKLFFTKQTWLTCSKHSNCQVLINKCHMSSDLMLITCCTYQDVSYSSNCQLMKRDLQRNWFSEVRRHNYFTCKWLTLMDCSDHSNCLTIKLWQSKKTSFCKIYFWLKCYLWNVRKLDKECACHHNLGYNPAKYLCKKHLHAPDKDVRSHIQRKILWC